VAARLLGFTSSQRRSMGAPVPLLYRPAVERAMEQVRRSSTAQVSPLSVEEAISLADDLARAC
jgi:hypothetical protein